jgi:protein-disulfide isomerase
MKMAKRLVEVFTSGCYLCEDVVKQVKDLACDKCEVVVYECETKAKHYGVKSVPAVAINGKLVDCCKNNEIDIESLKVTGLGQ